MFMKSSFGIRKKSSALEPHAQARNELQVVGIFACCPRQSCARAEAAAPDQGKVWRKFAPQLVAQSQSHLQLRQPGADATRWILLAVEIHFSLGLQDQALCEQKIVFGGQARRAAAALAHVGRRLNREKVRRKSLHAKRCPGARRSHAEVLTDARLQAPPTTE